MTDAPTPTGPLPTQPVVIAYDGSELSRLAIAEAGALLGAGHEALVVCVWQPFDVGFQPVDETPLNAKQTVDVRHAAERTASAGASLAEEAGFVRAHCLAVEASPIWKGIVETGAEHQAAVIVLGSHGRTGFVGKLMGSVAGAVVDHSRCSVLIIHRHE
jgi:nucleotide-binding universal stress UspA family protein